MNGIKFNDLLIVCMLANSCVKRIDKYLVMAGCTYKSTHVDSKTNQSFPVHSLSTSVAWIATIFKLVKFCIIGIHI